MEAFIDTRSFSRLIVALIRCGRSLLFIVAVLVLFLSIPLVASATHDVTIDGAFSDWDDEFTLLDDAIDDESPDRVDTTKMGAATNYGSVQPADTLYFLFMIDLPFTEKGFQGGSSVSVDIDVDQDGDFEYQLRTSLGKESSSGPIDCGGNVTLKELDGGSNTSWTGACSKSIIAAAFGAADNDDDTAVEISLPLSDLGLNPGDLALLTVSATPSGNGNGGNSGDDMLDPNERIGLDSSTGTVIPTGPTAIKLSSLSVTSGERSAVSIWALGMMIGGVIFLKVSIIKQGWRTAG